MTIVSRFMMLAFAGAASAPLVAQPYYPQPGYPQPGYPGYQYPGQPGYPGYQYPGQPGYGQNPIGQVIDQLLGNRYNVSDRQAVRQCAMAAVNQAQSQGYNQGYNRGYGYNNQGFARPMMRVTAITDVQRRNYGVRVRGLLDSGYSGGQYGYQNRSGYGDLSFRCDVDYRGGVSNVRIDRNNGYRRY